nr:reverse transcriptase domain-containing protein [Tanacetum cinerariifolium]
MRTRSKCYPNNSNATIPRRSNKRRVPNIVEPEIRTIEEVVPMADSTMEELLQTPTEGYGEAIVILKILAENFKIKTNLLQLVQTNKFHGFEKDNPHTHICNFKRMTSTLKYRDVPNDVIKLMLFPYSLEGAARIWVNTNSKDNSSKTDDRIDKLDDQILNLVEIVNKQVITPATAKAVEKTCVICGGAHAYYDCIATDSNQPSVCAATGIIKTNGRENFNRGNNFQNNQGYRAPMNNAPNFQNQSFQNQPFQVPNNQIQPGIPIELSSYMKSNELMIKSMQNQINVLRGDFNKQVEYIKRNLNNDMRSILDSFIQNQASTSGTLLSNIVPNPKGEMKVVTTRSGLAYEEPSIPTNSSLEKKLREKATNQMEKFFQIFHDLHFDISFADAHLLMPKFASTIKSLLTNKDKLFELAKVPLNENCSAMLLKKLGDPGKFLIPCDFPRIDVCHALADLADRSITHPKGVVEDVFVKVGKFHFPTDFVVVDFEADPRVPLILGRYFLRTSRALRVNDESVTFNLNQTMRYSLTYDDNSVSRVYVIDIDCEEFVQDVLDFQYNSKSSNPILVSNPSISESEFFKEPIVKSSSPTLTLFGERNFFLEEIKDFLYNESILTGIENSFYDPEGDILYLEKFLNDDPFQLPPVDLKQAEETKAKSSIEEPPELELKDLPSHIEYAFLEESDKLPVIIAKDLKDVEKEALIKVLKSHKRAIAWKISDIKGIDPRFCTHKILMEDDYKPAGGMTVVANENNELITTRLVTGWRVYIDYRKLNDATQKDHFRLPVMDQMLERLAGNEFYCFLDGFSRYFQIPIDPQDQEKTTFTCPYGTFACRRMPFGLCNAPGTFQRCMITIFHNMIEKTIEVFMDDFLVFGDSFSSCLSNLDKMLKRCEDTNLVLNWEKCHFMCKEGIVLGHKISKSKIEVDRAKVDVIAKLPHPTTVKGVKNFLGHAGFYRRFIQDFSKIAKPMTHLLEKETPFVFYNECVDAFNTLKKKLTEAPILVVPDWNLPFELMCDASDFAIGAVLGQRKIKHFQPIHYASKIMNEAQIHYTMTEKEMLAVVYAFEKFRPYLVLSKSIVYTDHSALKYILNKQDAKSRLLCHCVHGQEAIDILKACHEGPTGGHHGKLKTRWLGPFTITYIFPYGTIESSQPDGPNFKVNGRRVKHYFGGDIPSKVVPDLHTIPMDK